MSEWFERQRCPQHQAAPVLCSFSFEGGAFREELSQLKRPAAVLELNSMRQRKSDDKIGFQK
jgi:hypothetical protein